MSATSRAPLVSLIIRTKNEERWIGSCLRAVYRQDYPNFEVILVDNQSTDQTVAKARAFPVKLVVIDKFFPGKAINDGIRASSGEILVCLSGHCIPVTSNWLTNLTRELNDSSVAGVYGRQEPLSFSSPLDKRDLMITFGLDRRVQFKDSFFHNANSAFTRAVWDRIPFDEKVSNIEDRLWGKQVLSAGLKIVYEPDASVYHYHGIHQEMNLDRAQSVVRIMEQIEGPAERAVALNPQDLNVVAIIPARGAPRMSGERSLLEFAIQDAQRAKYLTRVIVATDDEDTAALARRLGAETPFLRPKALSEDYVDITDVLQYSLDELEKSGDVPDLIVVMEETHPFRPAGLIDDMIQRLVEEGLDSVVAAKPEARRLWLRDGAAAANLGDGMFMPRKFKEHMAYVGLLGLGCVTHPQFIREGTILGEKSGIFEVDDPYAAVEIRDSDSIGKSAAILEAWLKENRR